MPFVDPSLPLQKVLIDRMITDPGLFVLVEGRVFDAVPTAVAKPYISLGPFQCLPEHGDCLDGGETFIQVDAWALGPRTVAIKQVGAAIAQCLDEAEFTLDGNRLVSIEIEQIQYLREQDGITVHGVVSLRVLTDPIA